MSKNHIKLSLFSLVFIIGLIILMDSVSLGSWSAENLLLHLGGLNNYEMYKEQYIINYRVLGGILSLLSGFGIVINTDDKLLDSFLYPKIKDR